MFVVQYRSAHLYSHQVQEDSKLTTFGAIICYIFFFPSSYEPFYGQNIEVAT
jgi:hypothetical protein